MSSLQTPALREPSRPMSAQSIRFWRVKALLTALPIWLIGLALAIGGALGGEDWERWALLAAGVVLLLLPLPWLTIVPRVRYRIHRWDVTDLALHVRHGWLTRTDEIVPIPRIQTVDSIQGPLQARFGLRTVVASTASSVGTVRIAELDDQVARDVVAHLVTISAATAEDAT